MTHVFLHGEFGAAVGRKEWVLDVRSPAEAIHAIEANTGKALNFLRSKDQGKAYYRVVIDDKDFSDKEELVAPIPHKSIHFIPMLGGAGNGDIAAIIGIAIVLIVVAIFTYGISTYPSLAAFEGSIGAFGTFALTTALSIGISLTLSGLSSMLTKNPNTPKEAASPSYLFSGVVNTMAQGGIVPVGYGEAIVGSATISSGLSVREIALN